MRQLNEAYPAVASVIPKILGDGERIIRLWGTSGTTDVWDSIPKVRVKVYTLTRG